MPEEFETRLLTRGQEYFRRMKWVVPVGGAICFLIWLMMLVWLLNGNQPPPMSGYMMVMAALGAALVMMLFWLELRFVEQLSDETTRAILTIRQREYERDLVQQELGRRIHEDEVMEEAKSQFHSKLADYEKYAALAQLALGAAHEINNPLMGIITHLELEMKASGDPEQRAEIEACIAGAKRISTTIRGLMNYARPDPLRLSTISLDRLVSETMAFLQHQPMFSTLQMEKRIPADLPMLSADSNQMSQVLMNLLLNAAQATPQGGTITVSAELVRLQDIVEIRVRDTGTGVQAEILPHIFEPFFTTKRGQGTGLGLSICQAYVRSHGGEIHAESTPGRGTTIVFSVPLRQRGETRHEPRAAEVVG